MHCSIQKTLLLLLSIFFSLSLFAQQELELNPQGLVFPRLNSGVVGSPVLGQVIYDNSTSQLMHYNGTTWEPVGHWLKSGMDLSYQQGKVGVGTAMPSATFNVVGGGNAKMNNFALIDKLNTVFRLPDNNLGSAVGIGFAVSTLTDDVGGAILYERTNLGLIGDLHFATSPILLGNELDIRMTINSIGNVGIGTTNPTSRLQVEGDVDINSNLDVDGGTLVVDGSNNRVGIGTTNPTAKLDVVGDANISNNLIVESGNVGINTTNPTSALEVSGSSELDGNVVVNGFMEVNNSVNVDDNLSVAAGTFYVNSANEHVGIGTSTPTNQFHVQKVLDDAIVDFETLSTDDSRQTILNLKKGGGNINDIGEPIGVIRAVAWESARYNNSSEIVFSVDGEANQGVVPGRIEFRTVEAIFTPAMTTRMTIKGNGNVGIGTLNPSEELQINGSGRLIELVNGGATCEVGPDTGGLDIQCQSDRRLKIDIVDAQDVLTEIRAMRIRDYRVKSTNKKVTGPIAQEIQEVFPEMVSEGEDGYLRVTQVNQWKLIKAIQELADTNDALIAENITLKEGLKQTQTEMQDLRNLVLEVMGSRRESGE